MSKEDKKQTYSDNPRKKGRYNPWKWAFVLLLLFNLFIGAYWLSISITPQENVEQVDIPLTNEESGGPYAFKVQVSQSELTRIANDYLTSLSQGEPTLSVSIDESVKIEGVVEVFALDLPYRMTLAPQPLVNGDLKLDVVDLEISRLSLPVTFVMNIIGGQLDWPSWITIKPEEESILIMFNRLIIEDKVQVLVEKFDLRNDDIQLEVLVDNKDLFRFNNEKQL